MSALLCTMVLVGGCTPTLWSLGEQTEDCESPAPGRASAKVAPKPSAEQPVIMTLRTREHDVIVHGGGSGLRFTVADIEGTVLARLLDMGDFETRFPELHQHFETAFANEGSVIADVDRGTPHPDVSGWAGL